MKILVFVLAALIISVSVMEIFVEDAMASPSGEAHAITVKVNFPGMGRIRSTEQVLGAISR